MPCSAVFKTIEHRTHHREADIEAVVREVAAEEAAGTIHPWQQSGVPDQLLEQEPGCQGEVLSERWMDSLQVNRLLQGRSWLPHPVRMFG